jgi:hypothetical protein
MKKGIFKLTLLLFLFALAADITAQQNEMFKQKRERKRVWRKWRSKREAYNPYVDAKAKNKPSARMAKGDRKELKRQKRSAKRQLRRSKRKLNN